MIRRATIEDVGRMAEIIVYNNRKYYYPIFKDIEYSFQEFNVLSVAEQYRRDENFLKNTYLFQDTVIKGFISVIDQEVKKLYVDSFFQNEGIGQQLLLFAINNMKASHLWVLEKNKGAIRFYERYGFYPDGERAFEEGTTEVLLHMVRP